MRFWLAVFALYCGIFSGSSTAQVTFQDFAEKPTYRGLQLSPSGEKVGMIISYGSDDLICVGQVATGEIECLTKAEDLKPRNLYFPSEDQMIFVASKNIGMLGVKGRFENSAAFFVDVKTKKVKQLLRRTGELYPAQSGLGRILGLSQDGKYAFIPAYSGRSEDPPYSLFKVNLKTTRGRIVSDGRHATMDYFLDRDGDVLVREDYNNSKNEYSIHSYISGKREVIFEKDSEIYPSYAIGLTDNFEKLVLLHDFGDDSEALFEMDLTSGDIDGPFLNQSDKEIDYALVDKNRIVYGVKYSGMTPSYGFYDKKVQQAVDNVISELPMMSVHIDSWSDDWTKILVLVTGSELAGRYFVINTETGDFTPVVSKYPDLKAEDIAEIITIEYKARDGLTIPAIVTFPNGQNIETTKNAPIIVMPHGGPASYDQVGFDWMAQLFANQGYLVLQPNFRGSTGFGSDFRRAGYGEWGKAMQDDVTDGLDALVKMGWVDPNRACIVGWSYGGYSALAGGAFTPEKYKCVVSINGVSDLPRFLIDERRDHGSDHSVYSYWKGLIGDPRAAKDKLKEISPVFHADKFQAPVLLIHGTRDLIVPQRQSKRMEDALSDAGKPAELVLMKNQGHSLATANAKVEAFNHVVRFVNKHIGQQTEN